MLTHFSFLLISFGSGLRSVPGIPAHHNEPSSTRTPFLKSPGVVASILENVCQPPLPTKENIGSYLNARCQ